MRVYHKEVFGAVMLLLPFDKTEVGFENFLYAFRLFTNIPEAFRCAKLIISYYFLIIVPYHYII